jgi:hypothetical protein
MDLISVDVTMSLLESSPCLTFSVLLTNEGLIWLNQDEWTGEQKLQYTDGKMIKSQSHHNSHTILTHNGVGSMCVDPTPL